MVFSGVVNCTEVMSTEIGAAEGAVGQLFFTRDEQDLTGSQKYHSTVNNCYLKNFC